MIPIRPNFLSTLDLYVTPYWLDVLRHRLAFLAFPSTPNPPSISNIGFFSYQLFLNKGSIDFFKSLGLASGLYQQLRSLSSSIVKP